MIDVDVKELGKALLERAKAEAGDAWDSVKDEVEEAAKRYAQLTAASIRGEDVERDLAHAWARVLNWGWVGADRVRASWAALLEELAEQAGRILRKIGLGLLGAA